MADENAETPILSRLKPPAGAVRPKKRVGRGEGSGLGKTAGRGQKGQKARNPGNINKLSFEGGQMPLARRLPKRGFHNHFRTEVAEVNVRDLDRFDEGSTVDVEDLMERGLVKGFFHEVKILGNGEVDRKLTVHAHRFSKGARAKIEKAGGSCVELPSTERRRVEGEAASE